jgi:hypothetical protein
LNIPYASITVGALFLWFCKVRGFATVSRGSRNLWVSLRFLGLWGFDKLYIALIATVALMKKVIHLRIEGDKLKLVDEWRGKQSPIPSQNEAINKLVLAGLVAYQREAQK